MAEGDLSSWLVEKLQGLSLDAEVRNRGSSRGRARVYALLGSTGMIVSQVYQSYIEGILGDEDASLDERVQSVQDMLAGATEEDLTEFGEWCARYRRLVMVKPG
jgi:hypothetical protein